MHPTDDSTSCVFYKDVVQRLTDAGVPFVVGGAFAYAHYTGIHRDTKDLDLFLKRSDMPRVLTMLEKVGYRGELTFTHWLGKIYHGEDFVDLIFNSGNGIAEVDDDFFRYAAEDEMFGMTVKVSPVEEMIWTKAFVMERERYDGADIAHLMHLRSEQIDWRRLLRRFGEHWRLLLSHLILLGYIYPHEKSRTPHWVMLELLRRTSRELQETGSDEPVCGGTLVSREQFLADVNDWGYLDGRLAAGSMNEAEIAAWTDAIRKPH